MRIISLIVLLTTIQFTSFGQKITYDIPDGYEDHISQQDYRTIVDLAVPVIGKQYSIDSVREGVIHLKAGQDVKELNLHNLIDKCVAVKDKSQWDKVVQGHFGNIFASIDERKKIDPKNFETVRKYLSLRIYPAETVSQRGGTGAIVVRSDLEGTYTLLMMDLPGAFTSVSRQMFDLWKKDTSEVFKIAQDNVNKQQIEKVTKQFNLAGVNIEVSFLGNEDYAASYLLDLANNSPELVGEWGAVVAVPNKGLVDICKVSKDKPVDFVKFIQGTKLLIEKSYREHPQPISDQYFWYYKGKFVRINVGTQSDGSVSVIAPYGLTELMTVKK